MKTTKTFLVGLVLNVWAAAVVASPPYVNYQGQLNGADGQPLPTGNYTMQFNIYDQPQLGTLVWGPFIFDGAVGPGHGPMVPVVNGRFNVAIGPNDINGVSLSAAFGDTNRFMEITVADGPPILPRQQFLSTAYAFEASNAQYAGRAGSLIQELADALCPPGSIIAFGGTNIPSGWLLCDGRPLTNAVYPALFAAIGTNWGNGTLDSNGNPENPANPDTGFNLPDLRGIFLRGVTGTRSGPYADPEASSRVTASAGKTGNNVGSIQADRYQSHRHKWGYFSGDDLWSWNSGGTDVLALDRLAANQIPSGSGKDDDYMNVQNNTFYTAPTGDAVTVTETRPKNAYVNYIIKY